MIWIFIVLYLSGVIGGILMWLSDVAHRVHEDGQKSYCPAPRNIVAFIMWGFTGPIAFIVGICIILTDESLFSKTWWTRPICDWSKKISPDQNERRHV